MEDDPIPAHKAEFFWNDDVVRGTGGAEIVVMNIDVRTATARETGRDPTSRYDNSTGAHTADWMTDVDPQARPEGLFAATWLDGPSSREAIKAALREFGKIQECQWARTMYAALDDRDKGL